MTKPNRVEQEWLLDAEEIGIVVRGQFPINELHMDGLGGHYVDVYTTNMAHPITQWVHGNQQKITFESMFWAKDSVQSITQEWEWLIQLTQRDIQIKRPPVCLFMCGTEIKETVFVENVTNVKIGTMRPDGTLQSVHFTMTLRKYVPSTSRPTDPSMPEPKSAIHQVHTGDTYESIARDYYDQPLYGEALRRYHGFHPDLAEGDKVHVLPYTYVMRQKKLSSQSYMLGTEVPARDRLQTLFGLRSGSVKAVG
jgi:hypothetical protein